LELLGRSADATKGQRVGYVSLPRQERVDVAEFKGMILWGSEDRGGEATIR